MTQGGRPPPFFLFPSRDVHFHVLAFIELCGPARYYMNIITEYIFYGTTGWRRDGSIGRAQREARAQLHKVPSTMGTTMGEVKRERERNREKSAMGFPALSRLVPQISRARWSRICANTSDRPYSARVRRVKLDCIVGLGIPWGRDYALRHNTAEFPWSYHRILYDCTIVRNWNPAIDTLYSRTGLDPLIY